MKDILEHKNIIHILIILNLYSVIVLLIDKTELFKQNKITEVKNYSEFYTVSNSANLYLSYLSSSNKDSVYAILDNDYKDKKGITKDNVIEKLNDVKDIVPALRVNNMYEEEISKYNKKYYLKANLIDNGEEYKIIRDYYLIVTIDSKNNTYSITPYDGAIFKEENNE